MTNELPVFELERDCLYEMLSWEDQVQVSAKPVTEGVPMSTVTSVSDSSLMSTTMTSVARPRLPQLPLELWTAIVSYLTGTPDDLCWTWLNLRRVSRGFNAAIETAVRNCILRSAEIAIPSHRTKVVRSGHPPMVTRIQLGTIAARFSRLTDDGERAVFRDEDALERMGQELLDHTVKSWRRTTEIYLGGAATDGDASDLAVCDAHAMLQRYQFNQPPHVITMGGIVNDTELSGLEVDFDRLEMSFHWKHMVTNFLAEEERVRRLERTAKVGNRPRQSKQAELDALTHQPDGATPSPSGHARAAARRPPGPRRRAPNRGRYDEDARADPAEGALLPLPARAPENRPPALQGQLSRPSGARGRAS